jgi:glutathionyl-hydroquinone reductase
VALGRLVNGAWVKGWTERDEQGRFQRMPTYFRNWITAEGFSEFKAEPDRYYLYISLGAPHCVAMTNPLRRYALVI